MRRSVSKHGKFPVNCDKRQFHSRVILFLVLAFIIPVRHPKNCHSYERVLALLERTLHSVCAQKMNAFCVVVVGNNFDSLRFHNTHVQFIKVDFPPPSDIRSPNVAYEDVRQDKGYKNFVGLLHARENSPTHVMFVDADDFISNRLAGFVFANPRANGWYICNGYRALAQVPDELFLRNKFHGECGTCGIVRADYFHIPDSVQKEDSLPDLVKKTNVKYIQQMFGSHKYFVSNLAKKSVFLKPLPFRGAVHFTGHNENCACKNSSYRNLKLLNIALKIYRKCIGSVRVTPKIKEEFSLNIEPLDGDEQFIKTNRSTI